MSQLFASGGHKYWSFSFNISPSNKHPGLISFRMNWLDLLAVQGTASLVAQTVKHLPIVRETQVQSLGQEDLLEKEMATHSSILACKIPWTEEAGRLQSMRSQESDTT